MIKLPLKQRKRHILHIDADAFFASVEQVLNPKLRGKAIMVGSSSKKGIVSAASYEAKAFGIKTGMPMYLAKQKCPQAKIVPGHFEAYRDFSKRMYDIFSKCTPDVEMASIDEGYLDITGHAETFGETPEEYAKMILMEIHGQLGISASCGLASSKTVAKVASSLNKPHKLTVVPYGSEAKFLKGLELRAMPGIGPKTCTFLEQRGLNRLGDLASLELSEVVDKFGINSIPLWKRSKGVDNREVISTSALPKSISKEHTFYEPVTNPDVCIEELKRLSINVFSKLRSYGMKARTIFVKIRYKDYEVGGRRPFRDVGVQKNLDIPLSTDAKLFPAAKNLFLKNLEKGQVIRLIGVGVSGLSQNYNLNLFGQEEDGLFSDIDAMKKLYGDGAVSYGG